MKKKVIILTSFLMLFLIGCSSNTITLNDKNFFVEEGNNEAYAEFSNDGTVNLIMKNQESITNYEVFPSQYEGYDGIVIDGDYYLAEQQEDIIYLWGVTDNFNINEDDDYYTKVLGDIENVDMTLTEKKDF